MARSIPQQAKDLQEQVPKKRKKTSGIFKAVVSFTLCLALFVGMISPQIVWAASDALAQTSVVSEDTVSSESLYDNAIDIQNISDDEIAAEVMEGRDANTKFFRLTDGTTIAAIYDEPVHIKDSSGTWQNIDYRLSDAGDGYENQDEYNTMRVKFSKNPKNGKLYTLKTDDGQIKWSLSGVKESKKDAKLSQKFKKSSKLDANNISGTVTYEDILPGVTLQYLVTEGKLKENVIFANKESAGPLQFELQTNKFDVTIENNIICFNNEAGEAVFSMTAPYMIDNNGILSDKITLSLDGSKNHYTVTVTPDAEWLKNAAYPVTVDPIIEKTLNANTEINSIYVYSANPDSSQTLNYGGVTIGRESSTYGNCRGAFKFELPDNLTSADRVVAASLQLTTRVFQPEQSNLSVTVNAHQITNNIGISGLTWNKLNGKYSSIVSDSQVITLEHDTNFSRVPFDITNMVREWYRTGNNYGLALVSENENGAYKYVSMYTSSFPDYPMRWPALIIQYANTNGIENNLTYHSAGNSEVGTISVNDFNGNLVYTFDDVSTNGNLFPITVSHVYDNARRSNWQYYQGGCYVGAGFRLNLYERIVECSIDGYDYQYLDADGTWHYFKAKEGGSLIYVDEFYPNRVLKRVNKSDGTPSYFHLTDGTNIETRFTFNGYLDYKINRTNDKKTTISYIATTAIVDKITDGADKVIQFGYTTTNGRKYLTSVTDPAGRITTYEYNNERLTRVIRPDGTWFSLAYDSNGCLTSVTHKDGSRYGITYYPEKYNATNSLMRAKAVEQYGTDGASRSGKLTFVYGNGETTVTDLEGKSETMMFDDFGQTVSVRDHTGRGTFLKYNSPDITKDVNPNQTSNDESQKSKATQLAYTTKLQATVTNYVANPDFEDSTLTSWQATSSTQSGSGALSTAQKYKGSKSLKIQSTSNTGKVSYQQNLGLTGAAQDSIYTISAYVKITDLVTSSAANVSGAVVYFGYKDENGTMHESVGEPLQTVGDKFVRISHTLYPTNDVTQLYARIGLSNCTGIAYFDNVQVEKGSVANPYNYIDNGDFGDAIGTTAPFAYTSTGLNSSTDKIVTKDNRNCFKIAGERTVYKNIEQIVTVSGNAGDRYTFSAWAKSTGALTKRGSVANENRDFEIRIMFVRPDGTFDKHYYAFEDKTTSWQFLSGEAIADSEYVAVRMAFTYYKQKNTAYVDDLCLFKEGSNVSYTYDDWGRVETVTELADDGNKTTLYDYVVDYSDNASVLPDDRIEKITYPDGKYEEFFYGGFNGRLLTYHVDTEKIQTQYIYDDLGKLITTTVINEENRDAGTIVDNTIGYTTNGNYAKTITDPFGNTTTTSMDVNKGLVDYVISPYGTVTDYTYDENNDRLKSVSLYDSEVNYAYNTSGLLTSISHSVMFGYDVEYSFTYDGFGRRRNVYANENRLISYLYEGHTNRISSDNYGNGFSKQYSYDDLDNVTKVCYNNVEKFNWSYDYMGRVGLHNDLENNQQFRYTYDSKGRVESAISTPTAAGFSKSTFKNTFNAKDQLENVSRKIGGITLNSTYTYSDGGRLLKEQYTNDSTLTYQYDDLGRVEYKTVGTSANSSTLQTAYTFSTTPNSNTTTRVATENITTPDFFTAHGYQYDAKGNISQIQVNSGERTDEFEYDGLNQLTYALIDDVYYRYEYDEGGNILSKAGGIDEEYIEFGYGWDEWKDLLTNYGEQEIYYDEIGNPTYYLDGMTFTWQGRRLATASANGKSLSFKYNSDGIRTQKTVNGVTTYFTLDGSKIISQKTGDTTIFFEYDATGNVATMIYDGNTYYYVRNLMGEIIGLIDDDGVLVARYYYDPWGEITGADSFTSQNIASINPFRYKGYYYDSELGFYYLNSRYYDPEICRFINAGESIPGVGAGILNYNLFAYCNNNPIIACEVAVSSINRISSSNRATSNYVNIAPIKAMDTMVYYNVPLYDQDDYHLCWAFCQIMVEDYYANRIASNENATSRAISLSISIHGPDKEKWNVENWPTNVSFDLFGDPIFASGIHTIKDLYESLCKNGPIYGYYWSGNINDAAHLVVITGVNLTKGIIYTNNPWHFAGEQSYGEFMAGVAYYYHHDNMPFWGYLLID